MDCFTPNPDISGIGIRIATYVQVILSTVPFLSGLASRKLSSGGGDQRFASTVALCLSAIALLFSSITQAALHGMSRYHGFIILNLSWLYTFAALTSSLSKTGGKGRRADIRKWTVTILSKLHFILFGLFGLWFWSTVNPQDPCVSQLQLPRRSRLMTPRTRSAWLFAYCLYIILVILFEIPWFKRLIPFLRKGTYTRKELIPMVILALMYQGVFIGLTEQFIKTNDYLLLSIRSSVEESWNFGQVLAVSLLLLPIFDIGMWLLDTKLDFEENPTRQSDPSRPSDDLELEAGRVWTNEQSTADNHT